VFALILLCDLRRFASRHPHLSVVQIFKELSCFTPRRAVSFQTTRQQQRSEIMKHFKQLVNTSEQLFSQLLFFEDTETTGTAEEVRIL